MMWREKCDLETRGVASNKHVRGPQLNNIMLTIANMNQDIDTILKQDKSEGAMAPLGPTVAMPVLETRFNLAQYVLQIPTTTFTYLPTCVHGKKRFTFCACALVLFACM